jgi:hypothetical protein
MLNCVCENASCNPLGSDHGADFRRGDWVRVRGLDEILATLDGDAKLEGLPLMPEMVPYCGKTFRVYRRAEKTCVEGAGIRSMRSTLFLEGLRCDGSAHDGCQRGCLFFWKTAWLEPAGDQHGTDDEPSDDSCSHAALSVSKPSLPTTQGDRYYCQSTELAGATTEFQTGRVRHYLHDLWVGEIGLWRFAHLMGLAVTNRIWWLLHGRPFYQIVGEQKQTDRAELNLQPGELVEIKSAAEIRATLDPQGRNRGLSFEPEMAQYCGRRFRVARPIDTIISEERGKMVKLSNTVILDGIVCLGICVKNCPRANYLYWREIWLKRV